MRRTYIIFTCCVILLFVPIYLWQVKGWFSPKGPDVNIPEPIALDIAPNAEFAPALIEHLAKTDPVRLLERSLAHYRDHVHGYSCTLTKRERVNGKLRSREVIESWFREKPYSVLMVWKEGHDRASATLYSVEENHEKMFIRPHGIAGRLVSIVERPPDCTEARSGNRYLILDFGLRKGTERTYLAWKDIQERGLMNFEYQGIQTCEHAGNRKCHVITRHCDPATEKDPREREEGLTEITIFVDAETGLQVGTILKAKDQLIGEYYFGNIEFRSSFEPTIFKREHLKTY